MKKAINTEIINKLRKIKPYILEKNVMEKINSNFINSKVLFIFKL